MASSEFESDSKGIYRANKEMIELRICICIFLILFFRYFLVKSKGPQFIVQFCLCYCAGMKEWAIEHEYSSWL